MKKLKKLLTAANIQWKDVDDGILIDDFPVGTYATLTSLKKKFNLNIDIYNTDIGIKVKPL